MSKKLKQFTSIAHYPIECVKDDKTLAIAMQAAFQRVMNDFFTISEKERKRLGIALEIKKYRKIGYEFIVQVVPQKEDKKESRILSPGDGNGKIKS